MNSKITYTMHVSLPAFDQLLLDPDELLFLCFLCLSPLLLLLLLLYSSLSLSFLSLGG